MPTLDTEQSLMHLLQTFLVNTTQHVRAALPEEAIITTQGRTIVRGSLYSQEFGIRVILDQPEDDMWPCVFAIIDFKQGPKSYTERFDIHPDSTPSEHGQLIVQKLQAALHAEMA